MKPRCHNCGAETESIAQGAEGQYFWTCLECGVKSERLRFPVYFTSGPYMILHLSEWAKKPLLDEFRRKEA
jgi:hypothetical protein